MACFNGYGGSTQDMREAFRALALVSLALVHDPGKHMALEMSSGINTWSRPDHSPQPGASLAEPSLG